MSETSRTIERDFSAMQKACIIRLEGKGYAGVACENERFLNVSRKLSHLVRNFAVGINNYHKMSTLEKYMVHPSFHFTPLSYDEFCESTPLLVENDIDSNLFLSVQSMNSVSLQLSAWVMDNWRLTVGRLD